MFQRDTENPDDIHRMKPSRQRLQVNNRKNLSRMIRYRDASLKRYRDPFPMRKACGELSELRHGNIGLSGGEDQHGGD